MNIHSVYKPFQLYFRRKRMAQFVDLFGIQDHTEILDVGGAPVNWHMIERRPKVILFNLDSSADTGDGRFTFVKGDGRDLPYEDQQFKVVYSNSVIEHVGGPEDQQRFADEIRRVGAAYYVQTPNKYFPVEPHFITLGLQWLPFFIKRKLVRWCSVWGLVTRPSQVTVDEFIHSIRLLSIKDMKRLFPDAHIVVEHFLFMTKSIIAVKLEQPSAVSTSNHLNPNPVNLCASVTAREARSLVA